MWWPPALRAFVLLAGLASAACSTLRLPPDQAAGRAVVRADPAVSAGLPVQVRLRQVDGVAVSWRTAAAELLPGRHRLLVDCRVMATRSTARFALDVEVEAGREYRLVARASARDCDGVDLALR